MYMVITINDQESLDRLILEYHTWYSEDGTTPRDISNTNIGDNIVLGMRITEHQYNINRAATKANMVPPIIWRFKEEERLSVLEVLYEQITNGLEGKRSWWKRKLLLWAYHQLVPNWYWEHIPKEAKDARLKIIRKRMGLKDKSCRS